MRIFTYWHQPAKMPAYLQLCLATWERHLGDGGPILLTDANLKQWLPAGGPDPAALQQYPLSQQKDAILVAILAEHGGLFLDVDTLLVNAPLALKSALKHAEIVLYGNHLAAVAARPGSALMRRWVDILNSVLAVPREKLVASRPRDFFQLGNYSYELLREELVSGRRQPLISSSSGPLAVAKKLRRRLLLDTRYRNRIHRLDRVRSGYMPELHYFRRGSLPAHNKYQTFWFDKELPVSAALRRGADLIALHHSWTPDWYSALSLAQLRQDNCLLSRTLRQLL